MIKAQFCWHDGIECRAKIDKKQFDMDVPPLRLFKNSVKDKGGRILNWPTLPKSKI